MAFDCCRLDKQQVLASAVPQLLRRSTNPDCVDPTLGNSVAPVTMADPVVPCPTGLEREFSPIKDIQIGVVTSSLGDFGGDTCPEAGAPNIAQNDHAWLVGALPRTNALLPPLLGWTKADAAGYASTIVPKLTEFKNLVAAATELGCGNEMTLESWYRFLVDPKPPIDVVSVNQAANVRSGVDLDTLSQRKAFLRPDSLVAIVMLSDENDCSMRDEHYAWVPVLASGEDDQSTRVLLHRPSNEWQCGARSGVRCKRETHDPRRRLRRHGAGGARQGSSLL